ncbi:hypothetical protein AMJ51_00170 [Microgenomates bacterium DG_75]|nr:MAG: hypothetical protein AMJ51_00170 [Microgenomates bacterium DG_75]
MVSPEQVKTREIEIDPKGVEFLNLAGRRFDMPTKRKIASLCEEIGEEMLRSALREDEMKILSVYPQRGEGRLVSAREAAVQLGKRPESAHFLISRTRTILKKVGWKLIIGENSVETLKLKDYLYAQARRLGIRRIEQIMMLPEEQIIELCGSQFGLKQLEKAMKTRGIDWTPPKVEFPLLLNHSGY